MLLVTRPAGLARQGTSVLFMNSIASTVTPHRLYTFCCNGASRWMAVPFPPHFPSPEAQAQMLRILFQSLEAEYPGADGTDLQLTDLTFVDQMMTAGLEFAGHGRA
jgi:hypothetical protein